MIVREIKAGELPELLSLYGHLKSEELSVNAESTAVWEATLSDKNYHIIVAEVDAQIVSSCTLIVIPNLTHSYRPYALIENVVTHEDYRGRGLATACLDFAVKLAEETNCYKVMLLTGSKKESTLNFYRKAGFNSDDKTAFIRWLK